MFMVHAKSLLETFRFLGFKAIDYLVLHKELYCCISFVSTPSFFQKEFKKKERLHLMRENTLQLINFHRIITENKDFHLWAKLAKDKSLIIGFSDYKSFIEWVSRIENETNCYEIEGQPKTPMKILKFFEKLHWIKLIYLEKSASFTFVKLLPDKIKQYAINYLTSKFEVKGEKEIYYIS